MTPMLWHLLAGVFGGGGVLLAILLVDDRAFNRGWKGGYEFSRVIHSRCDGHCGCKDGPMQKVES